MAKRNSRINKVIIAYDFLQEKEINNKKFSNGDLAQVTGWSESTVTTYLSKKWNRFIRKEKNGLYHCSGLKNINKNTFVELHSQTASNKILDTNNFDYLQKAKVFALTAVTVYNNPCLECRAYSFIVNMIIAWTALFHAVFENNGVAPKNINKKGEEHTWALKSCIKKYNFWKDDDNKFIPTNLEFLNGLRKEVEHNILPILPDQISMYLQSCLLNFEKIVANEFDGNIIDSKLTLGLQLSNSSIHAQELSKTQTASNSFAPIYKYIKNFESQNSMLINDKRIRISFSVDKSINSKHADINLDEAEFVNEEEIIIDKKRTSNHIVAVKDRLVEDKYPFIAPSY